MTLREFVLSYQFPEVSDTEQEWQEHYELFRIALAEFWKSQGRVVDWTP